jgi:uncharacterized protein with von Willebrand factor type A (vWA) domain
MLTAVEGLVAELRAIGVPVSTGAVVDAARALERVDLLDRNAVRVALRAVLVKSAGHLPTFDTVFELFFGLRLADPAAWAAGAGSSDAFDDAFAEVGRSGRGGGRLAEVDDDELRELLVDSLLADDLTMVRAIARVAVDRHAAMIPGAAVAGRLDLFRVMRAMDTQHLLGRLVARTTPRTAADTVGDRMVLTAAEARVETFRLAVESEIRRRLVADRGVDAVARTLRTPLPEDLAFLHASTREVESLREVVRPLSRALASRLTERRRHRRRGPLDFRRTVRSAMSTGGVPLNPWFHPPHPAKPRLVVLADISGSVETFAAFTLQLVHALRSEFASVRSFAFVDGLDEVTDLLDEATDIADAARRLNEAAAGVWLDGRSDYGNALASFADRFADQLTARSTVLVLGDARSNYHAPREEALATVRRRAGALHWLNPEEREAWDNGDSIMSHYAPYCDTVVECRTVRQLRSFVEQLA